MRRSGRTFRLILTALTAMSEGKEVVIDCVSLENSHRLFRSALAVIESYVTLDNIEYNAAGRTLRVKGTRGLVRMLSREECLPFYEHRQRNESFSIWQDQWRQ